MSHCDLKSLCIVAHSPTPDRHEHARTLRSGVERRGLRPFLKWVGGKRQLLPVLRRFYPPSTGTYFEPFIGSGAVFFDLLGHGALDRSQVRLSDANADLIGCYRRVGDAVDAVIGELERLAAGHASGGPDHYRHVRDALFNPQRAAWRDAGADLDGYPVALAAMLIYLNRTGYNGLYRVNASGEYHVPPGRYDRPRIVDRPLLETVSGPWPRAAHTCRWHRSTGCWTRRLRATSSTSIRRTRHSLPPPTSAAIPGAASATMTRHDCNRWRLPSPGAASRCCSATPSRGELECRTARRDRRTRGLEHHAGGLALILASHRAEIRRLDVCGFDTGPAVRLPVTHPLQHRQVGGDDHHH